MIISRYIVVVVVVEGISECISVDTHIYKFRGGATSRHLVLGRQADGYSIAKPINVELLSERQPDSWLNLYLIRVACININ